ncbi:F-box/LRR-repeat protein 2-like [Myripristis murdjan]|uniref:F-box/LRR-repeat protein 2-like n=1 Tax=Myripristis murdjan TaxID=586833 RepID=UPI0011761C8F|nr:F-box/LRR-repeat protein 2-like [Myripristis murdjan]
MTVSSPDKCIRTPLYSGNTHTLHDEFSHPGLTSDLSLDTEGHVSVSSNTGNKYKPAGVSVFNCWLSLPDEVWLFILSLLPLSCLSTAAQVCHHLHRLASDQSLWRSISVEKCSNLTDQWLFCMGGRCPRKLSLYRCTGLSVTSAGLERFFSLSRKSLEELKVISCSGPGLHGDLLLHLIGQLCDHVTSVDLSWSGATDAGVKALTDSGKGLRLETVVLNGCQVTDDPLIKLITRHRERLKVLHLYGCVHVPSEKRIREVNATVKVYPLPGHTHK